MDNPEPQPETVNIKKPRKITVVKPSKYEATEAIHANKSYWRTVFQKLDTITKTPTAENESRNLSEVLPIDLYQKVCRTLNLEVADDGCDANLFDPMAEHNPRKLQKHPLISHRKAIEVDRDMDSDTDVEYSSGDDDDDVDTENIHHEFLQRPIRQQVTWATRYLQPEREDEKSLVRRADDLTDRIAEQFCEYMKQLGGDQQSQLFTPKAIKELFQVEFDTHAARSLRVIPKEIPCVEDSIAIVAGAPEKSNYAVLERQITEDIKAENRPGKVKAFDRSLPREDMWFSPKNNTKELWRSAKHVPKDLVTLKTVWEGITNLRSVKEYCRWMIQHPEHRRAPYLKSLGMFDPAVLQARLTFESQKAISTPLVSSPTDTPAPIEHIRRRLSQLTESNK